MQVTRNSNNTNAGPKDWFTGDVWIDQLITAADGPKRLQAAAVHFTPNARTAWHQHDGGQVIYVTEGDGRAQSRDGLIQEIRPGDTVTFKPGEWHWHGAAPGKLMVHIAMQVVEDGHEAAEWGEHVTDEEYNKQPKN